MATRTIQNINVTGAQAFKVSVYGLNPGTKLAVFFGGARVSSSNLKQVASTQIANLSIIDGQLITDSNGAIEFIYYYQDNIDKQNFTTEESYFQFAETSTGSKTLTVLDESSAGEALTLTTNMSRAARCFAQADISIMYDIKFTEIVSKNVNLKTTTIHGGGDGSDNYTTPEYPGGLVTDGEGNPVTSSYGYVTYGTVFGDTSFASGSGESSAGGYDYGGGSGDGGWSGDDDGGPGD